MSIEELSKTRMSSQHRHSVLNHARIHLERLKEMFARWVTPAFVHHLVCREIREFVIWLVFIVEQNLGTCMCMGPPSRRSDNNVGVTGIPASCASCEEGESEPHSRRVGKSLEGIQVGDGSENRKKVKKRAGILGRCLSSRT